LPKRYENAAWRNGGQSTSVVDAGITTVEIKAIRLAMRGTPLHLATTRAESNAGSIDTKYGVP
jgi:hypothetical protein